MRVRFLVRGMLSAAILFWAVSVVPDVSAQRGHGGGGHGGGGHAGGGHSGGGHGGGRGHAGGGHGGGRGHAGAGHGRGGHGGISHGGGGIGHGGIGHGGIGHGGNRHFAHGYHGQGHHGYRRHGYGHFGYHNYYPFAFGVYLSPWYGVYGYQGYDVAYNTVYVAPAVEEQVVAQAAVAQTVAKPTATSAGLEYQRRAEAAFRASEFAQAARMANHALVEMPNDGKLYLFTAQALFAVGDYRGAAGAIHQAASLLPPSDWGFVVENYAKYYRGRAFVDQMEQLNDYLKKNPKAAHAHFVRGYEHGFLGHDKSAIRDLSKALSIEKRDRLAAKLLERFGGAAEGPASLPAEPPASAPPASAPPASAPDAEAVPSEGKQE